ncbi:hypothetical protein [uncultured Jatrophihabitans sp.]|uniref:hypothetical protein n=1 Tax=uncultured Jatrophihabitans sp. TaxID=1610747 RepID=UPI0035C9D988
MTWWQVLLLVWGASSVPFAFLVARFLRGPALPPARSRIEFVPERVEHPGHPIGRLEHPVERPGHLVARAEHLVERADHLVERRDDQVA